MELQEILTVYGNVKEPRNLTHLLIKAREKKPIKTKRQLKELIYNYSFNKKNIDYHREVKLVFQALRVFVNGEIFSLKNLIRGFNNSLSTNSLAIIIGFHQYEHYTIRKELVDYRRVTGKKFCKLWANAKAPTQQEIKENPPSKSALMFAVRTVRSKVFDKGINNDIEEKVEISNAIDSASNNFMNLNLK